MFQTTFSLLLSDHNDQIVTLYHSVDGSHACCVPSGFNLCKSSQINVCVLMSQDIEHYWRISKQRPTLYLPPSYFRKSTPLAPPPPLLISLHYHTSPRLILPSLPIPTSLFASNHPVPCLPFLRMENGAYLRHFWFSFSELKGLSK